MVTASMVVAKFMEAFYECERCVDALGVSVPLPIFPKQIIRKLFIESKKVNRNQKPIIKITPDHIIVVGDIHGNIHNLFTIFLKYGFPPDSNYLFLGNLIDFGEFSLEVATLLIAFQAMFPMNIFLLKGFTESNSLFIFRGLQSDIERVYRDNSLYEEFLQLFSIYPIGAFVYDDILCSQPCWIPKIRDLLSMENKAAEKKVIRNIEAYKNLSYSFACFDPDILTKFNESINVSNILMGSCPIDKIMETYGNAMLLSACNPDLGCVVPMLKGQDNDVDMFDAHEGIERHHCSFKRVCEIKPISKTKGSIYIPQSSSKRRVNNWKTPTTGITMYKSRSLPELIL